MSDRIHALTLDAFVALAGDLAGHPVDPDQMLLLQGIDSLAILDFLGAVEQASGPFRWPDDIVDVIDLSTTPRQLHNLYSEAVARAAAHLPE
ncbi:MAG TPA: hypothetical protein VK507_21355 [Iamia sp.]|nr:hypothetical protein [Iamia sp.]